MDEVTELPPGKSKWEGSNGAVPIPGALAEGSVYESSENPHGGIHRVRYVHEDMVDFILANPTVTQRELAKKYGYNEIWVGRIINSDAFRKFFSARKKEFVNPIIMQEIEERFRALTNMSIDVVMEKLSTAPTLDGGLKALEVASRAQGYGVSRGTSVQVNNNYVVALPAKAVDGKAWLAQQGHTIDVSKED